MMARDDFTRPVIKVLGDSVNYLCSNPDCRAQTRAPHTSKKKATNVGKAAHIRAASPNGPRYDPLQTGAKRRAIENGIWLCSNCATKIDVDAARYSVTLLRQWKRSAESEALAKLGKAVATVAATAPAHIGRLAELAKGARARVSYTREQGDLVDTFRIEIVGVDRKHDVLRFIHEAGRDTYGDVHDAIPLADIKNVWEPIPNEMPIISVSGFMKFSVMRPYRYATR
jgi:hypothetical protein